MRKFIFCMAAFICLPVYADKVIGVQDGDTLTVLKDRQPLRIRLADIDAPEKKQAFGQVSKTSLSDMCFGKDASYDVRAIDKYGRTVARVRCAGMDVNRAQVERGLAWVYDKYNTDNSLPAVQNSAKARHIGLWGERSPMPPWEFRHQVVSKVADESGCFTGPKGGRYQMINGRKQYGC